MYLQILRMELKETGTTKGERERPKATWRRTVEWERNEAIWKIWNVAKAAARKRECWSENMSACYISTQISCSNLQPWTNCVGKCAKT